MNPGQRTKHNHGNYFSQLFHNYCRFIGFPSDVFFHLRQAADTLLHLRFMGSAQEAGLAQYTAARPETRPEATGAAVA